MRVLITGGAGFIAQFLSRTCVSAGATVLGTDVVNPPAGWPGSFENCEIGDEHRLREIVSSFRPDRIFHLAAQSYPTVSLAKARETMDINAGGTINVFECLRSLNLRPVVVVACSSAEYGFVAAEDLPVRESHALQPLHPYGVSKVAQDLLASQYFVNYGIPSVRIRIFNTTGPGKIGDVCSDLTRRAAAIELGVEPPSLRVGNLATKRALVDVRDLVRGLWVAAERCEYGDVYNLGGSRILSIDEVIETIRGYLSIDFDVVQDPGLFRPADEAVIAGDTTKFREKTGWAPEIDLTRTIRDMLDWWKTRLSSSKMAGL